MSWTLPEISYVPLRDRLEEWVAAVRSLHEEDLEFVVLFGSAARGEARAGSDLDLLVGLRSDPESRFLDRLAHFSGLAPAVEAFPYGPGELALMRRQFHALLLEASQDGRVLFDRGGWASLSEDLREMVRSGRVRRRPWGWQVVDPGLLDSA